ncbi:OsmC family protein [Flavobacterium ustbae]|uniref:OsmC family protein n=1 Tax=Flavobacterium ustbae TaxID=2488790 RepID=UPI001F3764E9|nr:OsmC family protein [Flavobacterium ustbae]
MMDTIKATIDTRKYRTEITSKTGNILISDEPQEIGGKNLGFSPFELLASSLASCTLITLRMYIDRKAWDVPELTIWVDFEKNEEHTVSLFSTKILITGNVDDTQRQRIIKIANSCPVHKTLKNTINIETSLV